MDKLWCFLLLFTPPYPISWIAVDAAPILCPALEGEDVGWTANGTDVVNTTNIYGYDTFEGLKMDVESMEDFNYYYTSDSFPPTMVDVRDDVLIYAICPHSSFILTNLTEAIQIPSSHYTNASKTIVIQCGENGRKINNCTISHGAAGHIRMFPEIHEVDHPTYHENNLLVSGVHFMNSAKPSIEIQVAESQNRLKAVHRPTPENSRLPTERKDIRTLTDSRQAQANDNTTFVWVYDCSFSENSGRSIHIDGFDIFLTVNNTFFLENEAFAAIHIDRGRIIVYECVFLGTFGSPVLISGGGSLSMQLSCTINNLQPVTIEGDSDLLYTQTFSNYGDRPSCSGVLFLGNASCIQFEADVCVLFNETATISPSISVSPTISSWPSGRPSKYPSATPSIQPTVSVVPSISKVPSMVPSAHPSVKPTISHSPTVSHAPTRYYCLDGSKGYVYWNQLLTDVMASEGHEIFVVCPDSYFFPVEIDYGQYTASDIGIYARNISIICGHNGSSQNNCTFHGGLSHFFIGGNADNVTIQGMTMMEASSSAILARGRPTSAMNIVDCIFLRNKGALGSAITVRYEDDDGDISGMSVNVDRCIFRNNFSPLSTILSYGNITVQHSLIAGSIDAENGWAVISADGTLSMNSSCIEDNVNSIFLFDEAELILNENNYGFNNTAGIGACEGFYLSLRGTCESFGQPWCQIYPNPSTIPTHTPSTRPSNDNGISRKPISTHAPSFLPSINTNAACVTQRPSLFFVSIVVAFLLPS